MTACRSPEWRLGGGSPDRPGAKATLPRPLMELLENPQPLPGCRQTRSTDLPTHSGTVLVRDTHSDGPDRPKVRQDLGGV